MSPNHTGGGGYPPGSRRNVTLRLLALLLAALLVVPAPAAGNVAFQADEERAVDVLFVVDSSDSMGVEHYELSQEMDDLRARIESGNVDARYALVSYNETARVEQSLTADYDAVAAAMDFPLNGSVENASAGVLTALSLDRRPDAATVVVLVTDEDDDATAAARQRAIDALSDVHFVTVSPDGTYSSSCAVHSPPCDNSTDNELRTVAEAVDGDWVDVARTDDALGGEVNDAVADAVGGLPPAPATTREREPTGPTGELAVSDVRVADSTVRVGEPVTVTATLRNVGEDGTEFTAWVATGDLQRLAPSSQVWLEAGESRRVSFTVNFDRPGRHAVVVSGQRAGAVTVESRQPANWSAHLDYELWQRTFDRMAADAPAPAENAAPATTREAFEARYPNLSYDVWRSVFKNEGS